MRLILLLLPALFACFLSGNCTCLASYAQDGKATDSPRELVKKVMEAYGGLDKIKQLRYEPYHGHGKVSSTSSLSGASNALECDVYSMGDKLRLETQAIGQRVIVGYDGKVAWSQIGNWVKPVVGTELKRMSESVEHSVENLLETAGGDCRIDPADSKPVQNVSCLGLKIFARDGKPSTLYIDPKTYLVLRSEYQGTDEEQGIPAVKAAEYSDFRLVDGCQSAFKSVEFSNGQLSQETQLDNIEKDPKITEAMFAMPAQTKIAEIKNQAVTVPFEYRNNQIIVKVGLNGKGPYDFILDTGASMCLLDKSTASTMGPLSQESFSITSAAKAVPLNFTTLSEVQIGPVRLQNVSSLVTDLSVFKQALGTVPAGLLGANILTRFQVTIDFKNHQLILADPLTKSVPPGAVIVPASPTYGASTLIVSGKLNGKKTLNFLVDTGAAFNILPASVAKTLVQSPLALGQMFGIDGRKINVSVVKADTLQLGNLTLTSPLFAVSPATAAGAPAGGLFTAGSLGILGNPTWSRYRMTLDYAHERLILVPNTPAAAPAARPAAVKPVGARTH